jgi:transposase
MSSPVDRLVSRVLAARNGHPAEPAPDEPEVSSTELRERRDRLAEQFAELQFDLGGLVYEMASRDHFRLDVVVRRAARLQEVDAELAEVERLLRLDEAGAAGACKSCGALYARGAAFCWQCGTTLLGRNVVGTEPPA